MAIKGTVEMEDTFVSWTDKAPEGIDQMHTSGLFVTVRDEPTRTEWSGIVDGVDFMAAMGIALSWEGEGTDEAWEQAEAVMEVICADGRDVLRFIP